MRWVAELQRTLHIWSLNDKLGFERKWASYNFKTITTPPRRNEENHEQDRQCTYNVTFRCVPATIVTGGKQYVLHNLSVYLWPWVSMQCTCAIMSSVACRGKHFSTLSHARHDFRQMLWKIKCVFRFSLQLSSETFNFKKNWARYDQKFRVCKSVHHHTLALRLLMSYIYIYIYIYIWSTHSWCF